MIRTRRIQNFKKRKSGEAKDKTENKVKLDEAPKTEGTDANNTAIDGRYETPHTHHHREATPVTRRGGAGRLGVRQRLPVYQVSHSKVNSCQLLITHQVHVLAVESNLWYFSPPANEVWGKVMFSQVSVCPRGRGGVICPSIASLGSHDQWRSLCPGRGCLCTGVSVQGFLCPGVSPYRDSLCWGHPPGQRQPPVWYRAGSMHPPGMHSCFYTPATKLGPGTCFYTCVWFCSQRGLPQCMLQVHLPREQVHPQGRYTPLKEETR